MKTHADLLAVAFTEIDIGRGHVYVLLSEGTIVYVGQTRLGVGYRLDHHAQAGLAFDRAFILAVTSRDLDRVEGALIRAFLPAGNTSAPRYQGDDNAVLVSLGLPPHEDEVKAVDEANRILRSRRAPYAKSEQPRRAAQS